MIAAVAMSLPAFAQVSGKERPVKPQPAYRMVKVDGLSIFYREAGPKDGPVILLLHGVPRPRSSSSRSSHACPTATA